MRYKYKYSPIELVAKMIQTALDYIDYFLEGVFIIWSLVIVIFAVIWLRSVIRDSRGKMKQLKFERLISTASEELKTMRNQIQYNKLIILLIITAIVHHFVFILNIVFFGVYLATWNTTNITSDVIITCGSPCMFVSGAPIASYQLYYLSIAMIITQIWCVYRNRKFSSLLYCCLLSLRTLFILVLWTLEETYLIGKVLASICMVFDLIWIAALSINTYKLMDRNLQLRVRHFRIHLDDNLINAQKRSVARFKLAILSFYPLFLVYTSIYVVYITVSVIEVIEMEKAFIHKEYGLTPGTLSKSWSDVLKDFYTACDILTDILVIIWNMPFIIIGFSKLKGIYQFDRV